MIRRRGGRAYRDEGQDMISNKVGKWSWALSGPECLAAAVGSRAERENAPISPKLRRLYKAMCEKQRKLSAREQKRVPERI